MGPNIDAKNQENPMSRFWEKLLTNYYWSDFIGPGDYGAGPKLKNIENGQKIAEKLLKTDKVVKKTISFTSEKWTYNSSTCWWYGHLTLLQIFYFSKYDFHLTFNLSWFVCNCIRLKECQYQAPGSSQKRQKVQTHSFSFVSFEIRIWI